MSLNMNDRSRSMTERTEPANRTEVVAESRSTGVTPAAPPFNSRSASPLERSVELRIDELALHGFAPEDRYAIGDTVERELTRLFRDRVPRRISEGAEIAHLDLGAIELRPAADALTIGVALAKAIYGGFD